MGSIYIKLRLPRSQRAREDLALPVAAFGWFLRFGAQLKSTKSAEPAEFTGFLWTHHKILNEKLLGNQ